MPGIADVQPKSIGAISLPVIPATVDPVTYNPQPVPDFSVALQQWNNARQSGAQNRMTQEQAAEYTSPEQVAARAAQTNLAQKTAEQQAGTLNTADLEKSHYAQYGYTMLGRDGKPNHPAMAYSGRMVELAKMQLVYAQAKVKMNPTAPVLENGIMVQHYYNDLSEETTPNKDGTVNKNVLDGQKMQHEAFKILSSPPPQLKNTPGSLARKPLADEGDPIPEPWHPDGSATLQDQTAPPDVSGTVGAPVAVVSRDVIPDTIAPTMVVPNSNQPVVLPTNAVSQATAPFFAKYGTSGAPKPQIFDLRDLDAYRAAQGQSPTGAVPVVLPNTPGVQPDVQALPFTPGAAAPKSTTITTDNSHITVTPRVDPVAPVAPPPVIRSGLQTGFAPGYSPKERTAEMKASPLYVKWTNLADPIGAFDLAVKSYDTLGKGAATTGSDKELANAVIRMQNPAGSSRGSSEFKAESLKDAAPYLEALPELSKMLLRTEAYPRATRARLIAAGKRIKESIEGPARSAIALASRQISSVNVDPRTELSDTELGLLKGGDSSTPVMQDDLPTRTLADGTVVRMKPKQ